MKKNYYTKDHKEIHEETRSCFVIFVTTFVYLRVKTFFQLS